MEKQYIAEMTKFGHDINGNPISHFVLRDAETHKRVAATKKRRTQCGYANSYSDAALVALQRLNMGGFVLLDSWKGDRTTGLVTAYFTVYPKALCRVFDVVAGSVEND